MEKKPKVESIQTAFQFYDKKSLDVPEEKILAVPGATQNKKPVVDENEFALNLLALGKVKGLGIHTLRVLIKNFDILNEVWGVEKDYLNEVLKKVRVKDSDLIVNEIKNHKKNLIGEAEKELEILQKQGIRVIPYFSSDFPSHLSEVPGAPYWLFAEGNVAALKSTLIGIVGTRTPSQKGIQTATLLAKIIASQGLGIVSGLAEGIDNMAHRMGVYYRVPQVAVLGTGIDVVFPASTKNTRGRLLEAGGVVVSEYLPGNTFSGKSQFVERNRIQAALSVALAPIESTRKGGTSHTVQFAEKYDRPIFGVRLGEPSNQNELLDVLIEHNHPVFGIDTPNEIEGLINWLRTVIKPKLWPKYANPLDREWLFQQTLRQLDDLLKFIPLGEQDGIWLQQQIAQRFGIKND